MDLNKLLDLEQYSLDQDSKNLLLFQQLVELHNHHLIHSKDYRNICEKIFPSSISKINHIGEIPFLPVSIFKNHELKSIHDEQVLKIITSSGTTGSTPSKIYLDSVTSQIQTKALSKIISHVVGNSRRPMLIIDSKSVLKDRTSFSARGAGILGLSIFGSNHQYVLDDDFNLDTKLLETFLKKFDGQDILIFGFTFMIWQYFYQAAIVGKYDLSKATLIHSGGWKKLAELAVDNITFKKSLYDKFNIKPENIYNFYGMVEQVGGVFLENSDGYMHCPNFCDIIIRNPYDFSIQPHGEEGLIQVLSSLPLSYPGHSLLTEDIGICMGEDNANNGWKGKYFKILRRAKKAELRGCSDTFTSKSK
jgi:hypothetical protein